MTEADHRPRRLVLAVGCFALVTVIGVLVLQRWAPLLALDADFGRWPQRVTQDHEGLEAAWKALSWTTATVPMTAFTALTALLLALRKHRRAAIWTIAVMLATSLTTTGVKALVGRARPAWDDPLLILDSYSFPSGHSSGIAAAAGVAIVLARMLLRRRGPRRAVIGTALAIALLVGADRIFLGVHNLSDVIAGWLLGVAFVALSLALFDPRPRSIATVNDPLPEALPVTRKELGVVINPTKVDDLAAFRAMVERLAAESGFSRTRWWETTAEDTGYAMAHEAAVAGVTVAIAAGGDGTVRAVCEELAGTGIPVGIVPAGTGNLLARNLDIPLYLRAAVDVALNGQDRAIDMVEVSGDEMDDAIYLVMAGMGFDAAIMEGVNEDVKARVGWLAYVLSGLRVLRFSAIRVEVSVDGGAATRHRARTVVIGNVGYLQAGMPLLPDATIDDGEIDVVLINPRRILSWVPIAARVITRSNRSDESLTRLSGREVVVRAREATPRQLDGDLIAPGRELRARCVPGRLLVRVPR